MARPRSSTSPGRPESVNVASMRSACTSIASRQLTPDPGSACRITFEASSTSAVSKENRSRAATSALSCQTDSSIPCTVSTSSGGDDMVRVWRIGSTMLHSILEGGMRDEDAFHVGELEHEPDLVARACDAQVAARPPGRLDAGDERAETRGVEEHDVRQIDHHEGAAVLDERLDLLAQSTGAHHVEPPGDPEDDGALLGSADGGLHHAVPFGFR